MLFLYFKDLPVEYSVVQSSFLVEINSSCGNSMPLSTSNGICGSHMKTRSSVVCETAKKEPFLMPYSYGTGNLYAVFFLN